MATRKAQAKKPGSVKPPPHVCPVPEPHTCPITPEALTKAQDEARKVGLANGRSNTLDDVFRAITRCRESAPFGFFTRWARLAGLDKVQKEIVKLSKEKTDDNQ